MKLLASLSKLKSLFPVFVVGASVAITIKLLTESSPTTSNIFQVPAEEDIKLTEYQDELVIPPEPKQEEPPIEPQSEPAPEDQTKGPEDEDKDKNEEQGENSDQQENKSEDSEPKNEENKEEKKDNKKPNLKFKEGLMGSIFSALLKGKQ